MNCCLGLYFILLTTFILISSCLPTGTARTLGLLDNEFCDLRPTLIPIGHPSYMYFPYYVTLYRCGGSDSYTSPLYRTCLPATIQDVKIQAQNLFEDGLTEITEKNHTSCKAGCTNTKEMCDTEMETWNEEKCRCQCRYPNGPPESCPTRFKWNSITCSCECNEEKYATKCFTNGKIWSRDKCGCECQPRIISRCKRFNKVLDENRCTCVDKQILAAQTRNNNGTGVSKSLLVGIVFGELLLLLFIFDLSLCLTKKWGLIYNIQKSLRKTFSRDSPKSPPPTPSTNHPTTTQL